MLSLEKKNCLIYYFMDKVEFENQYSLNLNKYIVLYSDDDNINDNLYIINDKYVITIVKFLLNSEDKINNKIMIILFVVHSKC